MRAALVLLVLVSCHGAGSPADAGNTVEAGAQVATGVCSLIEGGETAGVVRSICATVEEVAQIIAFILTLRTATDGGALASGSCTVLPGSTFCATRAETGQAITYIVRVRSARLMLDGGAR